MPVVRISLGRFDAANYDAIRRLLDDSQKTLIPAIRAPNGNRAYYVGIDPENNAMTNVSVWDTRTDAEQMATLQPMLDLAKIFVDTGVRFERPSPTTKYSGRCNLSGCANVIDYSLPGAPHKLLASLSMESRMFEGQKAVIIGGTSGIGLATAIELCRAGAQVWVTGRTADKTAAAAATIGDRAKGHAVDARDALKLQAFFAEVEEFDHLIVALGGGSAIGAFKDLDEVKMRAGFDNKFWPYLNAIRFGGGHIRRSGSITLITGAAGRRAIKGTSGLAAVNGALQAIIGPLALEFAPIRVNAVSPGLIATPYWDRMPEDARQAMYQRSAANVPVGRVGTPSDVGQAVLFLVSNEFTTGAILDCDGGARLV